MTDNIIDVDAVTDALVERSRLNAIDIMDAVFMRDGKVIEVSQTARDKFRFTGLNTISFVEWGEL